MLALRSVVQEEGCEFIKLSGEQLCAGCSNFHNLLAQECWEAGSAVSEQAIAEAISVALCNLRVTAGERKQTT